MKSHRKQQRKCDVMASGRWAAYAAAAASAGFAAAPAAEAEIHYSGPINQHVAGRHDVNIPLGLEGVSFLAGHNNYVAGSSSFSAGGAAFFHFYAGQSAGIAGATCSENDVCASNLKQGDAISIRPFANKLAFLAYDFYFNFWNSFGAFRYRGLGLVGFKFDNGAGVQYGWVRVKMNGPRRNMYTVVDFAYGDPGERVFAGQKSSGESAPNGAAPSLESLGGLALGGAGLLAWRRRRKSAKA